MSASYKSNIILLFLTLLASSALAVFTSKLYLQNKHLQDPKTRLREFNTAMVLIITIGILLVIELMTYNAKNIFASSIKSLGHLCILVIGAFLIYLGTYSIIKNQKNLKDLPQEERAYKYSSEDGYVQPWLSICTGSLCVFTFISFIIKMK